MQKIPLSKCFVNGEVEEAGWRSTLETIRRLKTEAAHAGTQHCVLGSSWTMIVYMMHLAQGLKAGTR